MSTRKISIPDRWPNINPSKRNRLPPCSTLRRTTRISNPSTIFDRVTLYPPKLGPRGPQPGPRLRTPPVPLEPSGQPTLTQAPDQPASLTGRLRLGQVAPLATIQSRPLGISCQTGTGHTWPTGTPVQNCDYHGTAMGRRPTRTEPIVKPFWRGPRSTGSPGVRPALTPRRSCRALRPGPRQAPRPGARQAFRPRCSTSFSSRLALIEPQLRSSPC
jgi:hypothetical protein